MNISELHNSESGPVALLGNGLSLYGLDLRGWAARMPLFGINQSWEMAATHWRCYVDRPHHEAIARGQAPAPKIAFHPEGLIPRKVHIPPMPCETVAVRWLPKLADFRPPTPFHGLELAGGSYAPFAGFFALEIATWLGFNPIVLLGYDGYGGHFNERSLERPENEATMWNESFVGARQVLDRAGVEVINATVGSRITAFQPGA